MAYTHLDSSNVRIFPYGTQRSSYPYDHVLNEQNITGMVQRLTDIPDYVISFDKDKKIVEFVLKGYYIKATFPAAFLTSKTNVYAVISITTGDGIGSLKGGDKSGKFMGVGFTDTEPTNLLANDYSMHVLAKIEGIWEIPNETKYRHSATNIEPIIRGSRGASTGLINTNLAEDIQYLYDELTSIEADDTGTGALISNIAYEDGVIGVTRRAIRSDDIPKLSIDKINTLSTQLAAKATNDDLQGVAGDVAKNKQAIADEAQARSTAIGAKKNGDTAATGIYAYIDESLESYYTVAAANDSQNTIEQTFTAVKGASWSADYSIMGNQAEITDLQGAITAINGDIESLEGTIGGVQTNVTSLQNSVNDLVSEEGRVTVLEGSVSTLSTKVSNIIGSDTWDSTAVNLTTINTAVSEHIEVDNPHGIDKTTVGLSEVANKSPSTLKKDFKGEIGEGNQGFVTGGEVHTAIEAAKTAANGYTNVEVKKVVDDLAIEKSKINTITKGVQSIFNGEDEDGETVQVALAEYSDAANWLQGPNEGGLASYAIIVFDGDKNGREFFELKEAPRFESGLYALRLNYGDNDEWMTSVIFLKTEEKNPLEFQTVIGDFVFTYEPYWYDGVDDHAALFKLQWVQDKFIGIEPSQDPCGTLYFHLLAKI